MFAQRLLVLAGAALAIAGGPAAAADGITATTVTVGQSAAFSGPAAELGKDMRSGIQAYFDQVNRAGGVNGRKLVLVSLDDGYEPDRAAENTRKFIRDDVFALLGYVGTPTSEAAKPIFTEARVPFVGAFTGAELLRAPFNRYIFNVRASYYAETDAIVELLAKLDLKRIAVFYQDDSYGKAGLAGVERAMAARNMKIIAVGTVERNSVDVAAAVKEISGKDPQAVVLISAYKSCAAFIKAMKQARSNPQFMNVSFVGSKALSAELGAEGRGVGISQVVPFPWNLGVPVVKDYQRSLRASNEAAEFGFGSLEGYIVARVFVEGLRRAGPNPTRESFIGAMETLRDVDLGGFYVAYTPTNHNGSKYVELTVIGKDGGFMR
ncbi:MAG TPA: ABC transporter substrate-binding protein [Casimicrobiaceae bacterium]|nr:ABC transporter substrate-binding protein [Casimicrobiaceae bacterium]